MKTNRWVTLIWISMAELFALSIWFSASAILPQLKLVWDLNSSMSSWVTSSVQMGFITGALISSFLGIADRFNSRRVFVLSAILGAVINFLLIFTSNAWLGFFVRFLTGVTLAGVYPTAVKITSQWFPTKKGFSIGILIASLTLGSALPHFIVIFLSNVSWQGVIITSSILALISAAIMYWKVGDPSTSSLVRKVSFRLLKQVMKNKKVMLANYGYFGHMWELYAMWTWLPAFLAASLSVTFPKQALWISAICSFIFIGIAGAIGSVIGGYFAEKIGKSKLTIIAMVISAGSCLLIGFSLHLSIWFTFVIAFIWGMTIIADSAQFSALVTEYASESYVGTALTFQMAVGFFITILSINLLPVMERYMGWEWAFVLLAIGPILGILSMLRLRRTELNEKLEDAVVAK